MLENRIKRLAFEENRARKKIDETKRKHDEMIRVKQRKEKDFLKKMEYKDKVEKQERMAREKY